MSRVPPPAWEAKLVPSLWGVHASMDSSILLDLKIWPENLRKQDPHRPLPLPSQSLGSDQLLLSLSSSAGSLGDG